MTMGEKLEGHFLSEAVQGLGVVLSGTIPSPGMRELVHL